jgi:hypothetical protein
MKQGFPPFGGFCNEHVSRFGANALVQGNRNQACNKKTSSPLAILLPSKLLKV